jgi:hypothetical protein
MRIVQLIVWLLAILAVLGIVDCFGWWDVPYICVSMGADCGGAAEAVAS